MGLLKVPERDHWVDADGLWEDEGALHKVNIPEPAHLTPLARKFNQVLQFVGLSELEIK